MKASAMLKPALVVLVLLSLSTTAFAAISNAGIMDNVLERYQNAASAWGDVLVNRASWLFWSLVLISMVWTYGMLALKKSDMSEFLAETIRFFVTSGFFWWLLVNGPAISKAIIDSLRKIGAEAVGNSDMLSPSSIADVGFDIFFRVIDQSSAWSPVDSTAGLFIGAVILIVLALVATNMLLLLIAAWMLTYGGVFFLGFGGGKWTTDIAISFYKKILAIGAQLMAMTMLVGIGRSIIDQYYTSMSAGISLKEMGVMLVVAGVLLYLVNRVPPLFAEIIGVGSGAGGIGTAGAGTALAAAGVAAAAAAATGSLMASGAANMAGGANALMSAFRSAAENMESGAGMFSGSSGGGSGGGSDGDSGGSGGGGGGGGGGSKSGGSGGFTSAMGTAGRFAADVGANLAKGAGQVAKAKADSAMASAAQKVSETTGGKIAAAIDSANAAQKASAAAEAAASSLPAVDLPLPSDNFDGDSLSASSGQASESPADSLPTTASAAAGQAEVPSEQAPLNDEVAAFANKGKAA